MIRPTTIPTALPIIHLITPSDLTEALTATKLSFYDDPDGIQVACDTLAAPLQHLIKRLTAVKLREIDATAAALAGIASACENVIGVFAASIPGEESHTTTPSELALRLEATGDPVLVALMGAARATSPGTSGAQPVADAILSMITFGRWAAAAAEAFAAGAASTRVSRDPKALRYFIQDEPDEALKNFHEAAIDIYVALTGQAAKQSRTSSGANANQPSGPLIRFLERLFACARNRCSAIPQLTHLAAAKEFTPSPNTLAAWIKAYKKTRDDTMPD